MQCHHINQQLYNELSKSISQDEALQKSRCQNETATGYTRCPEHGGNSLIQYFSRDLKPDQKLHFKELYENMISTYRIPTDNLFIVNILAATCREIALSHNADTNKLRTCISHALSCARELAITPREQKHKELHLHMGEELREETEKIEDIVKHRMELEQV